LLGRAGLQISVQKKVEARFPARDHGALIRRARGVDDLVREQLLFGERRQLLRFDECDGEDEQDDRGTDAQRSDATPDQRREQIRSVQTDAAVEDAEDDRRANESDARHEEQREEHRRDERADVIEAQHARDEILEVELLFQDTHQDWQFQSDERADHEDDEIEKQLEPLQSREAEEQQRRRQTAGECDGELDVDEFRGELAIDESREPGADAEGGEIEADDQRELRDRIAEHVAGNSAREQLVDQAARGDDQDVEKKNRRPVHQPCSAAEMISARPTITAAITIASAVFWSSSISFRIENGVTFTIAQYASAKTTRPKSV